MGRLRLTVALCAAGLLAMVWPAAQGAGQAPTTGRPNHATDGFARESDGGRSRRGVRRSGRRHADASESRRARVGLAGEGHDGPRNPAPALQPGERAASSGQADHQLHDFELRPRALLRGRQAFRLHLVRDAAQHDVLRRRATDDPGVPSRRSGSDGPHAGCARIEHSESHRPRRPWDHRSHRRRRVGGSRLGTLLPLSPVRTKERGWRRLSRDLEPAWPQLSRDDQRQHARDGDD